MSAEPAPPPPWLDAATLRRLRLAGDRARSGGRDPQAAAAEMRDALWARYPALPLTAIEEAARFLLPEPPPPPPPRLRLARLARLAARWRPA